MFIGECMINSLEAIVGQMTRFRSFLMKKSKQLPNQSQQKESLTIFRLIKNFD